MFQLHQLQKYLSQLGFRHHHLNRLNYLLG